MLSLLLSIIYEKFFETIDLMGGFKGGEDISRRLEYRVGGEKHNKINNFRIIGQNN